MPVATSGSFLSAEPMLAAECAHVFPSSSTTSKLQQQHVNGHCHPHGSNGSSTYAANGHLLTVCEPYRSLNDDDDTNNNNVYSSSLYSKSQQQHSHHHQQQQQNNNHSFGCCTSNPFDDENGGADHQPHISTLLAPTISNSNNGTSWRSGTTANGHHQQQQQQSGLQHVGNGANNNVVRSTKSQSKQRRDLINTELNHVRDLLPLSKSSRQRLSQLQVMACNNCYTRKCNHWFTPLLLTNDSMASNNALRRDETLVSFEFGKAMSSFYIVCTPNGKLLTIGDNTIDALGQSFEDLLAHGDCLHDLIYREDVLALRSMLELWPENAITRTTLVRINPARSVRRQGKYGEFKVVFVHGSYTRLQPYYSPLATEPVFVAECTPLLSPENREVLFHTSTNTFALLVDRRGQVLGIDERGCSHLHITRRTDLIGMTMYDLVEDCESLRQLQQVHRRVLGESDEHCAWTLLRLRAPPPWPTVTSHHIYVHALLQQHHSSHAPSTVHATIPTAATAVAVNQLPDRGGGQKKRRAQPRQKQRKSTSAATRSHTATSSDSEEEGIDTNESDSENDGDDDPSASATPKRRKYRTRGAVSAAQQQPLASQLQQESVLLLTLTCQVLTPSEALLLQRNRELIYAAPQFTAHNAPPQAAAAASASLPSVKEENFMPDKKRTKSKRKRNAVESDEDDMNDDVDDCDDDGGAPQVPAYFAFLPASTGFVIHDETQQPPSLPRFVPAFILPQPPPAFEQHSGSSTTTIEDASTAAAYLAALNISCPYVPLPPVISVNNPLPAAPLIQQQKNHHNSNETSSLHTSVESSLNWPPPHPALLYNENISFSNYYPTGNEAAHIPDSSSNPVTIIKTNADGTTMLKSSKTLKKKQPAASSTRKRATKQPQSHCSPSTTTTAVPPQQQQQFVKPFATELAPYYCNGNSTSEMLLYAHDSEPDELLLPNSNLRRLLGGGFGDHNDQQQQFHLVSTNFYNSGSWPPPLTLQPVVQQPQAQTLLSYEFCGSNPVLPPQSSLAISAPASTSMSSSLMTCANFSLANTHSEN